MGRVIVAFRPERPAGSCVKVGYFCADIDTGLCAAVRDPP
jgi:hypothetical protein